MENKAVPILLSIYILELIIDTSFCQFITPLFFFSVVHVAVLSKEISALKIITDMLVNLNVEDVLNYGNKNNSTPLQLAVETDQLEAVRMLMDSKAETHVMDREGETPVHSAVKNNNIALLKLLLSYDVSFNKNNNFMYMIILFIGFIFRPMPIFPTIMASFPFTQPSRIIS